MHGNLTTILLSSLSAYNSSLFINSFHFSGFGHGRLLAGVPPLYVLYVRGREEICRCGQRDQEDPQAAEEEGEKGNQNPPAGLVTAHKSTSHSCFVHLWQQYEYNMRAQNVTYTKHFKINKDIYVGGQ